MKRRAYMCECGTHAFAGLTLGLNTIVSPEDKWLLDARAWSVSKGNSRYLRITASVRQPGGEYRTERLSRAIMLPPPGMVVDHKNGDPLDNRRENLRVCTTLENCRNRRISSLNTTGFKGVIKRQHRRYEAAIWILRKRIGLGYYDTAEEAHAAYAKAAEFYFGEFARAA